jgi:hypothetical protein
VIKFQVSHPSDLPGLPRSQQRPVIPARKWIVTDPCANTRPRWRSGGQLGIAWQRVGVRGSEKSRVRVTSQEPRRCHARIRGMHDLASFRRDLGCSRTTFGANTDMSFILLDFKPQPYNDRWNWQVVLNSLSQLTLLLRHHVPCFPDMSNYDARSHFILYVMTLGIGLFIWMRNKFCCIFSK